MYIAVDHRILWCVRFRFSYTRRVEYTSSLESHVKESSACLYLEDIKGNAQMNKMENEITTLVMRERNTYI